MTTEQKHQKRMEYKRARRKAHNKKGRAMFLAEKYARKHAPKTRDVNKAAFDALIKYFVSKKVEEDEE